MKTTRSEGSARDHALLFDNTESLGSALGSIAAKVNAAREALSKLAQKGKELVRGGRKMAKMARDITGAMPARSTRRSPVMAVARRRPGTRMTRIIRKSRRRAEEMIQ